MNKQELIDSAMSKLSMEEQIALGLIKTPKKPRVRKNYTLTIAYMIGDSDGNTTESATISANNPFLDIVTDALDKLKAPYGHWGISMNDETFDANLKDKNITELEYDLLHHIAYYGDDDEAYLLFKKYAKELGEEIANNVIESANFLYEFEGLLVSDAPYSFLTYEGYKLK